MKKEMAVGYVPKDQLRAELISAREKGYAGWGLQEVETVINPVLAGEMPKVGERATVEAVLAYARYQSKEFADGESAEVADHIVKWLIANPKWGEIKKPVTIKGGKASSSQELAEMTAYFGTRHVSFDGCLSKEVADKFYDITYPVVPDIFTWDEKEYAHVIEWRYQVAVSLLDGYEPPRFDWNLAPLARDRARIEMPQRLESLNQIAEAALASAANYQAFMSECLERMK